MAQRVDVQYIRFYTQGNTAKRIAPAMTGNITGQLPQMKKRKLQRIYIDPVALLGIAVAAVMLVMMAVGVSRLMVEQDKTVAMQTYVEQLQAENESLQAKYDAGCDLETVQKTALALGMIPQNSAERVSIEVECIQQQTMEQVSLLQRIGTFLTGLFA
jgi:cell division protein FtsL